MIPAAASDASRGGASPMSPSRPVAEEEEEEEEEEFGGQETLMTTTHGAGASGSGGRGGDFTQQDTLVIHEGQQGVSTPIRAHLTH